MTNDLIFTKQVDCGALHKALVAAGFLVSGVTHDSGNNHTTVMLEDAETKDPTAEVTAYVYVPYVLPDYPVLYGNASTTVQNALTQYNTAKDSYVTNQTNFASHKTAYLNAVTAYNASKTLTNLAGVVFALAAAVVDNNEITTNLASGTDAEKDSISALVSVVTVIARRVAVIEES